MTRDAQAPRAGSLGRHRHQFRLQGAVQFDLDVAPIGIVVHVLDNFFRRAGEHFRGPCHRPGAVDETSHGDTRSDKLTAVETLSPGQQFVRVASKVPNACDPTAKVKESGPILPQVDVHIPEAREEALAACIDDLGTSGDSNGTIRPHGLDAVAADEHACSGTHGLRRGIEQVRVAEEQRRRRTTPQGLCRSDFVRPERFPLLTDQCRGGLLETFAHGARPTGSGEEQLALRVQPNRT